MYKWILPSISEVLAANTSLQAATHRVSTQANVNHVTETAVELSAKAEHQWRASLAATEELLLNYLSLDISDCSKNGFTFVSPAPVFSHPLIAHRLETIAFASQAANRLALMPFSVSESESQHNHTDDVHFCSSDRILPLLAVDPLAQERFCLVISDRFQIVLLLSEDEQGNKSFQFSFAPDVVYQVWQALTGRIKLVNPDWCDKLNSLVQPYLEIEPDYYILNQFSQLLLAQIPPQSNRNPNGINDGVNNFTERTQGNLAVNPIEAENGHLGSQNISDYLPSSPADVELLQAFAHEVRTPLATIRTLANLILRQKDLPATLLKRVQMIERECLDQIDRMELLFRAAELETSKTHKPASTYLTPMCLEQVLQQSIPRWQQFATRRSLTLDVVLPQKLPSVVSNPNMLDRMLTGLIENFTRSLPAGSHIQVQVIPAGDQLKLQLLPLPPADATTTSNNSPLPIRKAIGELLMFQPETGTISLNLAATKHLFQAIGGKLIVRQRPQYGEVMTIFLPLERVENTQSMVS